MTTYVARINEEGEIESVWTTGVVATPAEGTDPDDSTKTIVHIAGDGIEDIRSYRDSKYYKDGHFVDKPSQPGDYYDWKDEAWTLNSTELWRQVRQERSGLLYMSDWTQAADAPLTDAKKAEWVTYRDILRKVPAENSGAVHIREIAWPTAP
jgi:hypothetical protein|tara:strand:+ start:35 stop:490 length:456 start_codon:yes stop_codon:yes gene_type:complete